MIAKVLIDLSVLELNRLFDYLIPVSMESFLVRGMRVIVPFGSQKRLGIVMEITDSSLDATKEVIDCLDVIPSLNDELFYMLDHLKDEGLSLDQQLIETIIPKEMLVTYQKSVYCDNLEGLDEELRTKFNTKHIWHLKKKDQIYQSRLQSLKKRQLIDIKTTIKSNASIKKETYFTYNQDHTYARIDRYPLVLDLFMNQKKYAKKALLEAGVSSSTIQTLLKHHVLIETKEEVLREINHAFELNDKVVELTKEQQSAYQHIVSNLNQEKTILLKGITASGKTEIYLKLIDDVQKKNQQVLLLIPEIGLISQMAQRLKSRFSDVFIYHSGLSKGERFDQYRMILSHPNAIVLGTRVASFLPLDHLGLIIMDEEHDDSYAQKDRVMYHAREVLSLRSHYHQIPLLLGSATPSIDSMYQAEQGIYDLVELKTRATKQPLPKITFIDMKEELKQGNTSILSKRLKTEINTRLQKQEQTMLLYNRKGYAPFVLCRSCGDVPKCPHCDVSLTYYKEKNHLKCHYCGYEQPFSKTCHVCEKPTVKEVGAGIDYVEHVLKKEFPEAKILRMDSKQTSTKGSHELLWKQFHDEEADILLGTHMIAKGFDFPKVTLVGILMADLSLKVPSYQASEKAYMLFAQMTGRSGRFLPGQAIIQGYQLDHYAIKALTLDYDAFYHEVMIRRKAQQYAPFYQNHMIVCSGLGYLKTYQVAMLIKKRLSVKNLDILGPTPALISKIKDQYRFTLTIKQNTYETREILEVIKQVDAQDVHIKFYPTLDVM